jgi:hypothetical protein
MPPLEMKTVDSTSDRGVDLVVMLTETANLEKRP